LCPNQYNKIGPNALINPFYRGSELLIYLSSKICS
jgi:hypothetical protein